MHILKQTAAFFLAILLMVPMITMGHAAAAAAPERTFADVNPGDWYYNTVMDLVSIGAVSGKGDGLFHPNDIISAVELANVALLAMPGDKMEDRWTQEEIDGYRAQYQEINPGYWGNEIIMNVQGLRGLSALPSTAADFWALPVSRVNPHHPPHKGRVSGWCFSQPEG